MPPLRTLAAILLVLTSARADVAFDALIANEQLWSLDQPGFQAASKGLPFEWTSNQKDSARVGAYRGMTLYGRPIYEMIARFEANKLSVITTNFYARGDAGDLSEAAFKTLLTQTIEAITNATGAKHTVRGKDPTSAVKAEGLIWSTPKGQYLLEYSFIREVKTRDIPFRAEFVRLEMRPVEQKQGLVAQTLGAKKRFDGPSHVKKDAASGDVWIGDVPMVDQGQKGYCVVSSTERVMRYYGVDVDANELAQVANSDASQGTDSEAMRTALKKLATRLKVRVNVLESLEVRDVQSLIKDYNRAAKRSGEQELPPPGHIINLAMYYRAMKGPVLRDARTHNKAELSKFEREVQANIDSGVPLLWSVQLGLFPEPGLPQSGGGHMRLIIGYNPKTQEILFTDSWGAGHELKRKKLDDAWTITTGLVRIEPMSS